MTELHLVPREVRTETDLLVEARKAARHSDRDIWTDSIWARKLKRTPDRPEILAVIRDEETGCAVWQGSSNGDRHAAAHGRPVYRWYYEYFYGKVPAKHDMHHLCENGMCVNPEHLIPVTRSEHMRIEAALRAARGLYPNRKEQGAKLNVQEVRAILAALDGGMRREVLASQYRVSISTIARIASGQRWGHVREEHLRHSAAGTRAA